MGSVGVSFTGNLTGWQTSGGTNYYVPDVYTFGAEVDNPPPTPDILRFVGGGATGTQTITFDTLVVNPVIAIVSLGQTGVGVRYQFDAPFAIVSQGTGYWGGGPTSLVDSGGNVLTGHEGHGALLFTGTYSSISWTMPDYENWHGITVGYGASSPAAASVPVPPAGLAGFGLLALLGAFRVRRRRSASGRNGRNGGNGVPE